MATIRRPAPRFAPRRPAFSRRGVKVPASFIAPTPYSNTPVPRVVMPPKRQVMQPKTISSVVTGASSPAAAISTARKAATVLRGANAVLHQHLAQANAIAAQVSDAEARGNKGHAISLRHQALSHIRAARSTGLRLAQAKATYERAKIVAGGLVLAAKVESNGQMLQASSIRRRISKVNGSKLTFAVPSVLQHGSVAEAKAADEIHARQASAQSIISVNGLGDVQLGDLGSIFSSAIKQATHDVSHAVDQATKAVSGAVKQQACSQAGASLGSLSYGGSAVPASVYNAPEPDFLTDIPSSSASSGYVPPAPAAPSSASSSVSAAEKAAEAAAAQYARQVASGACRSVAPKARPAPQGAPSSGSGNGTIYAIAAAGALIAAKALAIF